jgi:putative hydrolase of HD superfamily
MTGRTPIDTPTLPAGERLCQQIGFVIEMDKLKTVLRQSYVIGTGRHENAAEHSWHLPVMAMVLAEYAGEAVDLCRVLEMLLVHDIIEVDAGDTFCYDEEGARDKEARERRAAGRIFGLLPADQAAGMRALWDEFEAHDTPEARFANAVDRLMPLLHNYYTEGRSWQAHGISRAQVLARNARIADSSARMWQLAQAIIEDSVARGYLAP